MCKHESIRSIYPPKITLSESQLLFHQSASWTVNRSKGRIEVTVFSIEISMFLLWKGINHELTSGVGNGRRIRTGSCKIRAGKNRKKADAVTIRSLQIRVNSASSLALACSAVQTSSAALSKAGLSCLYQCPSFAEVSSVAEMLNVRGRGAGRAGVAAKPAKTHSACKC